MANVDNPRGFKFVKSLSGSTAPQVRAIGVTDGADLFIGDALTLTSGLAARAATNDTTFLGVAVGFGKVDPTTGSVSSMINPGELELQYYDDSASTHTDFVVFYIPAEGNIFEGQTDADLDLSPGDAADILATAGDTATGISNMEVDTSTNADLRIVEIPDQIGDDPTLANAVVWFMFNPAETAFGS